MYIDLDLSLKPEVTTTRKNSFIPFLCSLPGSIIQCLVPDSPDFQTPIPPPSTNNPYPHLKGPRALWMRATDQSAGGWDSFPVLPRLSLLQWWPKQMQAVFILFSTHSHSSSSSTAPRGFQSASGLGFLRKSRCGAGQRAFTLWGKCFEQHKHFIQGPYGPPSLFYTNPLS